MGPGTSRALFVNKYTHGLGHMTGFDECEVSECDAGRGWEQTCRAGSLFCIFATIVGSPSLLVQGPRMRTEVN